MPDIHVNCGKCGHKDVFGTPKNMYHANPSLMNIMIGGNRLQKRCFKKGCKCVSPCYEKEKVNA